MSKTPSYQLKRRILLLLRDRPKSFTQIQTKLSTNYDSVKNNCEELQFYDFVKIKTIERHPENGKPSFDVALTDRGFEITKKIKSKEKE